MCFSFDILNAKNYNKFYVLFVQGFVKERKKNLEIHTALTNKYIKYKINGH